MHRNHVKHLLAGFIGIGLIALAGMQCKSENPLTPPPPSLELLYPKGSDLSFKVGDTVRIKWSIHDTNAVNMVGISYSLDGGKSVNGTQLIVNKSFFYPDTTYLWKVDSAQCSNELVIVIWDYNGQCITGSSLCLNPYHDKSAPFIVTK